MAIPVSLPFLRFLLWCNSFLQKKRTPPLDTKPIVVYSKDTSMDTHTKWTGTRHKPREPIPGRKRARPLPLRPYVLRFTPYVSRLAAPTGPSHPRPTTRDTRPAPGMSPRNCTFSLHFPLHILKTHTADRCRSTTYAKCARNLCNSALTLPLQARRQAPVRISFGSRPVTKSHLR